MSILNLHVSPFYGTDPSVSSHYYFQFYTWSSYNLRSHRRIEDLTLVSDVDVWAYRSRVRQSTGVVPRNRTPPLLGMSPWSRGSYTSVPLWTVVTTFTVSVWNSLDNRSRSSHGHSGSHTHTHTHTYARAINLQLQSSDLRVFSGYSSTGRIEDKRKGQGKKES